MIGPPLAAAPAPLGRRGAAALAAILAAAAAWSALCLPSISATYDEPLHYRYGAQVLAGSAVRFDNSKMPISALNALPARLGVAPAPFAGPPAQAARGLLAARLVTVLFWTTTLLVVFAWARELYGPAAGWLALLLAASEPNLAAHAQLVTTDAYAAGLVLLASWRFWKFQVHGGRRNGALAALATAVAQLGKYSAVYLLPVFAAMAVLRWRLRPPDPTVTRPPARDAARRFLAWAAAFVAAFVLVVNAGFLFDRTFVPFGRYAFRSEPFRALQRSELLALMPVPLPYPFLEGLDWVKHTEQTGEEVGTPYLNGRLLGPHESGFPAYYLLAVLYKVPIPTLLLVAAGIAAAWRRRGAPSWDREWFVAAPAAFFVVFFSLFFRYQAGIRYLLVAFPLLFVLGGAAARAGDGRGFRRRVVAGALLAWQAASLASWFPWYLPYFNETLWDRTLAYRRLADSNLDWGQADGALDAYVSAHPDVLEDPAGPVPGRIAVSANLLTGVVLPERMAWLRAGGWEPTGHVAYAHVLFDVSEESLRRRRLWPADPAREARRHADEGVELLRESHFAEAGSAFRTALRLDPGFADAWAKLGVAEHQRDRFPEAERAYRRALELAPAHAHATRNLAFLLGEEGRVAEEIALLERAVAAGPPDHELERRLSEARTAAAAGVPAPAAALPRR